MTTVSAFPAHSVAFERLVAQACRVAIQLAGAGRTPWHSIVHKPARAREQMPLMVCVLKKEPLIIFGNRRGRKY